METLPTELGALILENVADIGSLWAFVQVSHHVHGIFRECREQILSAVIARDIGPVLMGEALAALDSARFTFYGSAKGDVMGLSSRGPPKSEALEWIENYCSESEQLNWGANRRNLSLSSDVMLPLWSLHREVKFMAQVYVQETLSILNQFITKRRPRKPVPHTLDDLSPIEKDRLLRAIYRFVIFGNLFGRPPTEWSEEELCEHFLCRFPAWQVEELSCVNDFMTNMIRRKWQEMEDNEFQRLAAGDPQLWEIEPRPDPWNCRWDADFYSKETKSLCFEEMQAFFVRLPVEVLRALFQAEGAGLEELVRGWAAEWRGGEGPFLGEALHVDPSEFPVVPGGELFRYEVSERSDILFAYNDPGPIDREKPDDVMSANISWHWAHRWQHCEMYYSSTSNFYWPGAEKWEEFDRSHKGLRRIGYVFWDRRRLNSLEEVDSSSFGRQILQKFPRPTSPDQSLSVEERIRKFARCECGGVIRPEDSKCTTKGHRVEFTYPCRPEVIEKEV